MNGTAAAPGRQKSKRFAGCSILGLVLIAFALVSLSILGSRWNAVSAAHAAAGGLLLVVGWRRGELGGSGFLNRRSAGITVSSFGLLGLILFINVVMNLYQPFVYDSTEQKIFTLAPQTRQVLAGLAGELNIRGAFTGGKVRRDVSELFNRLRAASPFVNWSVLDPERDLALVEKLGINEVDTVHFSYRAPEGVRESKLTGKIDEQAVINTVLKLTRGKPKSVYYITGHSEPSIEAETQSSYRFLRESIEGENIQLKDLKLDQSDIPADAVAIVLAAPQQPLLPGETKKIETYLVRGGRAILLAEPLTTSDVADLARIVGIEVGTDVIIDKNFKAGGGGGLGIEPLISSFGVHPITDKFHQRLLLSGAASVSSGALAPAAKIWDKPHVAELAFSGPESWAEKRPSEVFSEHPEAALDPEDQHGPVSVAAAFQGNPRGGIDGETRVVVLGDGDFLSNVNLHQQFNKDFFLNCLNWVAGNDNGITIRPVSLRESKTALSEQQFDRMFVVAGIIFPELIMILGLIIWNSRRW